MTDSLNPRLTRGGIHPTVKEPALCLYCQLCYLFNLILYSLHESHTSSQHVHFHFIFNTSSESLTFFVSVTDYTRAFNKITMKSLVVYYNSYVRELFICFLFVNSHGIDQHEQHFSKSTSLFDVRGSTVGLKATLHMFCCCL